MNIFLLELKQNAKSFLFWLIGLGFLMYAGMVKFSGLEAAPGAINELFASWPKAVLATFGMAGLDVTSLAGYFAILWVYAAICGAIYGLGLGIRLTTLEINDRNSDFVYSKPLPRVAVLGWKALAHVVYLVGFMVAVYLFSLMGIASIGASNSIHTEILLLCGALKAIEVLFYGIGALCGAIDPKRGSLFAYLILLGTYVAGILYDVVESGQTIVRIFSPFKYFDPALILVDNAYSIPFLMLSAVLFISMMAGTAVIMSGKDL